MYATRAEGGKPEHVSIQQSLRGTTKNELHKHYTSQFKKTFITELKLYWPIRS